MKYILMRICALYKMSHPARGAWIEIIFRFGLDTLKAVAPRKGCVD